MKQVSRGQIYYADLDGKGSEQKGLRPVLIIQNDIGNKYSPTTIIAIITTRKTKANLPTHIWLNAECGLPKDSMVELEQVRTIDKVRLSKFKGTVSQEVMKEVDMAIKISLGLSEDFQILPIHSKIFQREENLGNRNLFSKTP